MIRSRLMLTAATALALAACAEKPAGPPFDGASGNAQAGPEALPKPAAGKPAFKKPIRMNGRGEVTSISLEKFFELHQTGQTLVFDARPGFFHSLGHIPGAVSLPKHRCDEAIAKREAEIKAALAAGKTIVVYCTGITCPDARTVARHISGFGYPASVFSGGWDAWKDAGMPTE